MLDELAALEAQEAELGAKARSCIDDAQRKNIKALQVLQDMEVALFNSQDTLVVARHLQELEDTKRRHAQVISYAETFEKLSEDEQIATMHIE